MTSAQQEQETPFQNINKTNLIDAALFYASKGIRVFPLQPNSKLPVPKWPWKKIATTDPVVISAWWRLYPTANIGLAVGKDSGLIVLDIDVKNGQDGTRSYQAITQERYTGCVQNTPSGGVHLLFQYHPGLINFTHKGTLGGLDMRTDGGYILAAPSVVEGISYEWSQDGDIPVMPGALLVACEQWSKQSNTSIIETPDIPEELPNIDLLGLDVKYLNYLKQGITTPWRDDESVAIFAVAGALMRKLNDSASVFGIMADNAFVWACAERHRQFGYPGDWLWKYGISKIVAQAEVKDISKVFNPLPIENNSTDPASQSEELTSQRQEGWITWGNDGVTKANFAPDWIVRGLIERGQVGLVYGDSQALKSYLCLDLAAQVSMGGDWHGHAVVNSGKVLFIAGEGNAILWRRLEAFRQRRELKSEQLKNLGITGSGLNLMDREHLVFLKQQIDSMGEPPILIIIDTLSRNAVLDENSAKDISELINICDQIAKAYNSTVILVHHTGKSNKSNARGSSALEANTDFIFKMERLEGDMILRTKLTVQKLKGAPEPKDAIIFRANTTLLMGMLDEDMVPLSDLVLARVANDSIPDNIKTAVSKNKEIHRLRGKALRIVEVAQQAIISNRSPSDPNAGALSDEIFYWFISSTPEGGENIDPSRSNFNTALRKLVERGYFIVTEDNKGNAWYRLTNGC